MRFLLVAIMSMILLMDMIVAGYDFEFKMGWPRGYLTSTSAPTRLEGRARSGDKPLLKRLAFTRNLHDSRGLQANFRAG